MIAWQLSNTLEGIFCIDALHQALSKGRPTIFNTDQGAQFAADAFTACLLAANIRVSMGGPGRVLNQYDTVPQLQTGIRAYLDLYNRERPHQSLNYRTHAEEHFVLRWRRIASV